MVRKFALALIITLNSLIFSLNFPKHLPSLPLPQEPPPQVTPRIPIDPELVGVQVPIPKEFRVYNKNGSSCVWCSIEVLARYHKIEQLYDLTSKYKYATGPNELARVLNEKNIKFIQINKKNTYFLEEYVKNKKLGCGVGVNGNHVINIVHFDKDIVKIIDNSDKTLKIQTWQMNKFMDMWDGWAFVLLPS